MAKSLFKRNGSDRKVSLRTQELDFLTQNTDLKDREKLQQQFDAFIVNHPKGIITPKEFQDIAKGPFINHVDFNRVLQIC